MKLIWTSWILFLCVKDGAQSPHAVHIFLSKIKWNYVDLGAEGRIWYNTVEQAPLMRNTLEPREKEVLCMGSLRNGHARIT